MRGLISVQPPTVPYQPQRKGNCALTARAKFWLYRHFIFHKFGHKIGDTKNDSERSTMFTKFRGLGTCHGTCRESCWELTCKIRLFIHTRVMTTLARGKTSPPARSFPRITPTPSTGNLRTYPKFYSSCYKVRFQIDIVKRNIYALHSNSAYKHVCTRIGLGRPGQ